MGKADAVAASLDGMRLAAAAKCVRDGVAEALTRTRLPPCGASGASAPTVSDKPLVSISMRSI